ncbi:MAG: DUF3568 family protein [Anaerolineae bacterium]|nr:DUF3568 family protein [Phycisphaerae bacterium]
MKKLLPLSLFLFASIVLAGCQSKHQEGVTSDYRAQWMSVNADTTTSTEAARAVLADEGLKDIQASSTNVDGRVTGKKADNTQVTVTIKKQTDTTSQVSVVVGTVGQPALGAELARKIKDRVEGSMKTR